MMAIMHCLMLQDIIQHSRGHALFCVAIMFVVINVLHGSRCCYASSQYNQFIHTLDRIAALEW